MGFLALPPQPDNPRQNGAGVPDTDINLGQLVNEEWWNRYVLFLAARSKAGRNCRGHASIIDNVKSLLLPGSGAIWLEASYFANLPGVLSHCPSASETGEQLHDPIVRFRAACARTHAVLAGHSNVMHFDPLCSRPSREPTRKIDCVISNFEDYPVEALCHLICAIEAALPPRVTTVKDAVLQRILAVLQIAAFRPFRASVWPRLTMKMIVLGPNGSVSFFTERSG
jgi:hypothetical protein